MWRNYDNALYLYLIAVKDACVARDISVNKNWDAITDMHKRNWFRGNGIVMPPWLGDERVHLSHRQNLYNKDPKYYKQFQQDALKPKSNCCDKCNYFWPTHTDQYNAKFEGYIVAS